jgi:diguanylate cyclase (GGDEF)-like protein
MQSTTPQTPTEEQDQAPHPEEIRTSLRSLDREDAWRWWNAVLVITLLMAVIVILTLPKLLQPDDPFFQSQVTLAVRGLLGLVLIFNAYVLYQQRLLRQLRDRLAGQIELSTEQKARAEAYRDLAILDPLTGLYNRRFSQERLHGEIERAKRYNTPLAVVVFDLDHFKRINDTLGHAAGDFALKEFARHLSKTIRGADFAVRNGGDEFMIVLPECPPDKVETVLSRLVAFEAEFEGKRFSVSASRGAAQYQPPENAEELIARADAALYEHKIAASRAVPGRKYGTPRPAQRTSVAVADSPDASGTDSIRGGGRQ